MRIIKQISFAAHFCAVVAVGVAAASCTPCPKAVPKNNAPPPATSFPTTAPGGPSISAIDISAGLWQLHVGADGAGRIGYGGDSEMASLPTGSYDFLGLQEKVLAAMSSVHDGERGHATVSCEIDEIKPQQFPVRLDFAVDLLTAAIQACPDDHTAAEMHALWKAKPPK
jgi:hypothetical protein